jgi:hypothetical protein
VRVHLWLALLEIRLGRLHLVHGFLKLVDLLRVLTQQSEDFPKLLFRECHRHMPSRAVGVERHDWVDLIPIVTITIDSG